MNDWFFCSSGINWVSVRVSESGHADRHHHAVGEKGK